MTRGARREGLSRRHRFQGRDSFRPLLRAPRKLSGNLAVIHIAPGTTPASRFGLSIGRRAAKSAVVRNRVKRIVREAVRRHSLKGSRVDVVITLTPRFDARRPELFLRELTELLDRAGARVKA